MVVVLPDDANRANDVNRGPVTAITTLVPAQHSDNVLCVNINRVPLANQ